MKSWSQPYGVQDEQEMLCWQYTPAAPCHRMGIFQQEGYSKQCPATQATRGGRSHHKSIQYFYWSRYQQQEHRIDLHIDSDSLQEPISYKRRYKSPQSPCCEAGAIRTVDTYFESTPTQRYLQSIRPYDRLLLLHYSLQPVDCSVSYRNTDRRPIRSDRQNPNC